MEREYKVVSIKVIAVAKNKDPNVLPGNKKEWFNPALIHLESIYFHTIWAAVLNLTLSSTQEIISPS